MTLNFVQIFMQDKLPVKQAVFCLQFKILLLEHRNSGIKKLALLMEVGKYDQ